LLLKKILLILYRELRSDIVETRLYIMKLVFLFNSVMNQAVRCLCIIFTNFNIVFDYFYTIFAVREKENYMR
jgi:hypothetical protein